MTPDPNPFNPTPADRAAAWRVVLAMLNEDLAAIVRVTHEAQTEGFLTKCSEQTGLSSRAALDEHSVNRRTAHP